jgi:hypothetical protein
MATILEPATDRGPAPESSDRSFGFVKLDYRNDFEPD